MHEAVQEYLQVGPMAPTRDEEEHPHKPKAMHNKVSLDEAIIHVDLRDDKGLGKVRRLGETPETGAASSQAPVVPVVEFPWHSNARGTAETAEEQATKRRSRPFRMPSRNVSGSGMHFRPGKGDPPQSSPNPEPRQEPRTREITETKRRSQPIRKFNREWG